MRDCVDDRSVLWLFLNLLLAELTSVWRPLLFVVEFTETQELPRVLELSPERVVVSLCEPSVIGRLILQQIVTSLWWIFFGQAWNC